MNPLDQTLTTFNTLVLYLDHFTSHGIIWRKNPFQIIERYSQWANDYQENQITIVYDTMWNGTKVLAEKIAEGIESTDPNVVVKVYNIAKYDENDVITEVFVILYLKFFEGCDSYGKN